ncbi:hypothetical protein GCM10010278_21530 [Streptomyces melanogenes]|nr:hypothetical protein GCM10010278_21530 [Streptomyces melanogenes]
MCAREEDERAQEPGHQVRVLHQRGQRGAELPAPLAHHLGAVEELGVLVVPDVRRGRAQVHQPAVEFEADAVLEHQPQIGGDRGGLVHEDGDAEQQQPAAHRLGAVVAAGAVDHPLEAHGLERRHHVEQRGEGQDDQGAPGVSLDRGPDQEADGCEALTHGCFLPVRPAP